MLLTSMYNCQVYQYYYNISYERCDSSLGIVIGLQAGMWDQGSILSRSKGFVPSLKNSVALGPSQHPGWIWPVTSIALELRMHELAILSLFHMPSWLGTLYYSCLRKNSLMYLSNITMQLKWYRSSPKAQKHTANVHRHNIFNHIHKMFIIYNLCFR